MSEIWDRVDRFVDGFSKLGRIADLRVRLIEAQRLDRAICGNCTHWMKTSECPREQGVMKGGPSCADIACNKFALEGWVKDLKAKRIREIQSELSGLSEAKDGEK